MKDEVSQIQANLEILCDVLIPRALTQVCRDPGSQAYGSFDRAWWHYKTIDFPSIILQQGGYLLMLSAELKHWKLYKEELTKISVAAARFWARRAMKRGAFEEYYPFEQGYPPLAFSTMAVMKIIHDMRGLGPEMREAARRAAGQLESRFERHAANQQVAGLAAYAWTGRNYPELFRERVFRDLKQRTLALQREEGWFVEYGGPDLGYLSVTLDCLWDLADATGDGVFVESASRALRYIASLVGALKSGIGMHNARNTDYLVPYGIVRFLERPEERPFALFVLETLFGRAIGRDHFLQAVDDRYVCHYTGHSIVRACLFLQRIREILKDEKHVPDGRIPGPSRMFFPGCGHHVLSNEPPRNYSSLVSLRKGGVLTAVSPAGKISDFGWTVWEGRKQFTSHWWSDRWVFKVREEKGAIILEVDGHLEQHKEIPSGPWKHMILRIASFFFGRHIIGQLKKRLIFKERNSKHPFQRRITLMADRIIVSDVICNVPRNAIVERAPRASKRHVASADSFHFEDLRPCSRGLADDVIHREENVFRSLTTYKL